MNYFDAIVIIFLLWGAYRGFTKGLIIAAASLIALVLGIWGAVRFSDWTAELLVRHFDTNTPYLSMIAFALTFVAIVLVVHLLAQVLDKLVKAIALGFINRLAGVAFNVLKIAFILSIVVLLLDAVDRRVPFIPEDHKEKSLFYRPLSKFATSLFPYLSFEGIRKKESPLPEDAAEA